MAVNIDDIIKYDFKTNHVIYLQALELPCLCHRPLYSQVCMTKNDWNIGAIEEVLR